MGAPLAGMVNPHRPTLSNPRAREAQHEGQKCALLACLKGRGVEGVYADIKAPNTSHDLGFLSRMKLKWLGFVFPKGEPPLSGPRLYGYSCLKWPPERPFSLVHDCQHRRARPPAHQGASLKCC